MKQTRNKHSPAFKAKVIVIVPLGGSIVTLNRGGTMMSTKKYLLYQTDYRRTTGTQRLGPNTSKPAPGHRIFPYLLKGVEVNRVDQVWAADITYIPMAKGFLYLVAIMDWHSRHVLAWKLSNTWTRGRAAAYKQTHARILLMSDESRSDGGMKDADITSALGVGQSTVERANTQALCGGGGRVCAESQKATASASKETGRRR